MDKIDDKYPILSKMGTFFVPSRAIHNNPDKIISIYAKMRLIPVKVEYLYDIDGFEITGFADCFQSIPRGGMALKYLFDWNKDTAEEILNSMT